MKLETNIKPRRDGTVTATAGKASYVFAEGADGRLIADVADESHVGFLLATGNFVPADEADFQAGMEAVKSVVGGDDDEVDQPEIDDDNPGGLPVEANTPPSKTVRKAQKV